jgi:glutathione S-transferase
MADRTLEADIAAADAVLADPSRRRVIGAGNPRFLLYGSAFSICTQKLRMVLLEKGAAFGVRDMDILPPRMENTHPAYVRLRLQGVQGRPLVQGFTGRSAVATEGIDPVAVPTVLDLDENRVLVDAVAIAAHLNAACPGLDLAPARIRREVDRACAAADALPQIAVMYGAHPEGDFRPRSLRDGLAGAHDARILKLMEGRSLAVGQPRLTAAYDAKIRKEAAGRLFVRDPRLMRAAVAEMVAAVAGAGISAEGRAGLAVRQLHPGRYLVGGDAVSDAMAGHGLCLARRACAERHAPPEGGRLSGAADGAGIVSGWGHGLAGLSGLGPHPCTPHGTAPARTGHPPQAAEGRRPRPRHP